SACEENHFLWFSSIAGPVHARTRSRESSTCVLDPRPAVRGRAERLNRHNLSALAGHARIEVLDPHHLVEPDPPVPTRYVRAFQLHGGIDAFAIVVIAEHLHAWPHADDAIATAAIPQQHHDMAVGRQLMHQRLELADAVLVGEHTCCFSAHEAFSSGTDRDRIYALKRQERVKCGPSG